MSAMSWVRRAAPVAVAAVALLAVGAVLARGGRCAAPRPRAPVVGPAGAGIGERRPAAPSRLPADLIGRVVRIRDGDSIVVLAGGAEIEVRFDGVDCPELRQAFGRRAKRRTSELASGREVRVAGKGRDQYDRELAEVFLPDGRSLNRELVSEGLAWWYRRYSSDADLAARERAARAGRLGLWADPDPVPPWEFRAAAEAGGRLR